MVAGAAGDGPGHLARQAAGALAVADDPPALLTACRRLLARQPAAGPLWWLAARVLAAADPAREAWESADRLRHDPTPSVLADALPACARVTVLGWPEQAADALRCRGELSVLVVDALGDGRALAAAMDRDGCAPVLVGESGLGAAAAASSLVLLDAHALGPGGVAAVAGSRAAAAVGRQAGAAVLAAAGVGRVLPARLWAALAGGLARAPHPWDEPVEVVPLELVDAVLGPGGASPVADSLGRAGPDSPELART